MTGNSSTPRPTSPHRQKQPAPRHRVQGPRVGRQPPEITTPALRIVYEHDGFPFGLHNFAASLYPQRQREEIHQPLHLPQQPGGPIETLDRVTGEIPTHDGLLEPRRLARDRRRTFRPAHRMACPSANNEKPRIGPVLLRLRQRLPGCPTWGANSGHAHDPQIHPRRLVLPLLGLYLRRVPPRSSTDTKRTTSRSTTRSTWGGTPTTHKSGPTRRQPQLDGLRGPHAYPRPRSTDRRGHRRGVTVSLNDHPHDGIRPHEEMYADPLWPTWARPSKPLLFDVGDRKIHGDLFQTCPPFDRRSGNRLLVA